MTDTAAARAYPPEPDDPLAGTPADSGGPASPGNVVEAFPPAAHAHALGGAEMPAVSPSSTAVLDSQPPLGFLDEKTSSGPGESPSTSAAMEGEGPSASHEPPPFGFNAPGAPAREEPAQTLSGQPARRAPIFTDEIPRRPELPRALMATQEQSGRRRLGDAPTPTFGPPGRERTTAAMVALSVITLGWYAVAWHRRVNQEMGDFDPRIHVHPARSAWAVALPLLAGLLASAGAGAVIGLDHRGVALDIPVSVHQAWLALAAIGAVPYLVLLLPFSLVAVTMTAERVRVVEDHAGVTTDEQLRPAALVGWLLVPVIGGFVVMARQQRSLNRIWQLARS